MPPPALVVRAVINLETLAKFAQRPSSPLSMMARNASGIWVPLTMKWIKIVHLLMSLGKNGWYQVSFENEVC